MSIYDQIATIFCATVELGLDYKKSSKPVFTGEDSERIEWALLSTIRQLQEIYDNEYGKD